MVLRSVLVGMLLVAISGCSVYAKHNLEKKFGHTDPENRKPHLASSNIDYWRDIKPILDSRCVTCHSCYDAPCQLKLGSLQGLERGAYKSKVYNGSRLLAGQLTRLFEDGKNVAAWRAKKFSPILNEREQSASANIESSVLAKILELKHQNPTLSVQDTSKNFTYTLFKTQQCPTIHEFARYANENPSRGMPYGLPAISNRKHEQILQWLSDGAPYSLPPPLSAKYQLEIDQWEKFLNGDSLKQQLMSRYLYEHLFLSNLHFTDLSKRQYMRLFRSKTPPGETIEIVSTRRPFDDPGQARVYYRLQVIHDTVVTKTHMPYALNQKRMSLFEQLFLNADYQVTSLPSYKPKVSSNPFAAFADIPVESRYRFLLEEARHTIMGFIKGAVCRGQVALGVIQDHFWVFFVDPDSIIIKNESKFARRIAPVMRLPAEKKSNTFDPLAWIAYSQRATRFHDEKLQYINDTLPETQDINLSLIWDGDGHNDNAALTIFRNFDSGTVVKGMVGETPKTAWVISYTLLERIHYLLVAGFDVYGNVVHQLYTRLYMDFLRMDGEFNFLAFLPMESRMPEWKTWYEGADKDIISYASSIGGKFVRESGVQYKTDKPKLELFAKLQRHLGVVFPEKNQYSEDTSAGKSMKSLESQMGQNIAFMPEFSIVSVRNDKNNQISSLTLFSLMHNVAVKNVSNMFYGKNILKPSEDYLTVTAGIVASYPNVLFDLDISEVEEFVNQISLLKSKQDYQDLKKRFAISRTDEKFWPYSDKILAAYQNISPLEWGVLDYSRLEYQ